MVSTAVLQDSLVCGPWYWLQGFHHGGDTLHIHSNSYSAAVSSTTSESVALLLKTNVYVLGAHQKFIPVDDFRQPLPE